MLVAYLDKTAYAVCTFAFCAGPGEEPILFQGRTEGKIVDARGPGVFGWDAVFEYQGETYAEMDRSKKVSAVFCVREDFVSWLLLWRRTLIGGSCRYYGRAAWLISTGLAQT